MPRVSISGFGRRMFERCWLLPMWEYGRVLDRSLGEGWTDLYSLGISGYKVGEIFVRR
jgi:hypothetical protein